MTKKILVVEDSAFFRKMIIELINKDERFEVVDYARNGLDALKKVNSVAVDAITLDLEMPEMNGVKFLEELSKRNPKPVLVLSENIENDEEKKKECLEKGATNWHIKDELLSSEERKYEFLDKLANVANSEPIKKVETQKYDIKRNINLVIIGSSTGGPKGLHKIIKEIDEDFPVPILIVQHMANGFTKSLADNLNDECRIRVKEVERGDILEKGVVYIAPAGYQTKIEKNEDHLILNVSKDYSDSLYKPSIDTAILSATKYFGKDLLVTILTGMGEDGMNGAKEAKEKDAIIFAESKETAVVYGMPKAVIDAGIADDVMNIEDVYKNIKRKVYKN